MKRSFIADTLWGNKAQFTYLFLAAIVLLFTALGAREIWTQEHRWADIVTGMFYRHDFLHPYLGDVTYYDKPLLSYWLIAVFAQVTGTLSTWALRMPSALAGLLAIYATYLLGTRLHNRQYGLLSGWMLLTTFFFVFWSRTSSADMLNVGGSMFAVAWYMQKRNRAGLFDYSVFFLIVALTSLCKGLVGAIVPAIAVLVDVSLQKSWRQHLRLPLFLSLVPAMLVYFFPFWASSHFGGETYGENGLYLVYKENILRYFQPFDHQGPLYTYFIYLPLYLMPWSLFLIPALWSLRTRWCDMTRDSRWLALTLLGLFVFFTLSGSRRSYYVLPLIPFAILFVADWIVSGVSAWRQRLSMGLVCVMFVALFVSFDVVSAWFYGQYGVGRFAEQLKMDSATLKPWNEWHVVMLDAESKLNFYLQLPPSTPHYFIDGDIRETQTLASLLKAWPIIMNKPADTIFITRKQYADLLQPYFMGYHVVAINGLRPLPFFNKYEANAPVAFVPDK